MFAPTDERLEAAEGSLRGSVIAVTGSAGAIGSAVVDGLLARHATVAALDIAEPVHTAPAAYGFRTDITDGQSVAATVEEISNRLGRIDGLVNCAGILHADWRYPPLLLQTAAWVSGTVGGWRVDGCVSGHRVLARVGP